MLRYDDGTVSFSIEFDGSDSCRIEGSFIDFQGSQRIAKSYIVSAKSIRAARRGMDDRDFMADWIDRFYRLRDQEQAKDGG